MDHTTKLHDSEMLRCSGFLALPHRRCKSNFAFVRSLVLSRKRGQDLTIYHACKHVPPPIAICALSVLRQYPGGPTTSWREPPHYLIGFEVQIL